MQGTGSTLHMRVLTIPPPWTSRSKKIQITEGAMIENLAMRVGPRMIERSVSGTVVWKSGHALEDTYPAVYSGDKYVRRVEIEDDGTFKFILYGDFAYSIEARDFIDEI
jgi:hypothetical protein